MNEAVGVIGSALGIIAALVSGGAWLMKLNFRLSQQTLKAKQDLYAERFENLKKVTNALQTQLLTAEKEFAERVEGVTKRLEIAHRELQETKNLIVKYVETTDRKMKLFETRMIEITNDLKILKSKPKGSI